MKIIKPADVIAWQNEIISYRDIKGEPFSLTYLKTIHNQLTAILNHAVKFYELKLKPDSEVGNVGKDKTKEMLFWTKQEYLKFSESMMDKPVSIGRLLAGTVLFKV